MTNSIQHFTHGQFRCTLFAENKRTVPADKMYPDIPADELQPIVTANGLEAGITFAINVLLIDTGSEKILIDAGYGGLVDGLESEGIPHSEIDHIIVTHGHDDHIGGILTAGGTAAFPNAQYWIPRIEWKQWHKSDAPFCEFQHIVKSTLPNDRIHLLDDGDNFMTGFTAMAMPGHRDGMMGVIIESEGQSMLHIADVMHHPLQLIYPHWCVGIDHNKPQARQTRRMVWQRVADEHMQVFSAHVAGTGRGTIIAADGIWQWQVVEG